METKSHKRLAWVKEEEENLYNAVTINMTPIYDKNEICHKYWMSDAIETCQKYRISDTIEICQKY